MRLFGSIVEIIRIFFRKDGKKIEWKPNQAHTYSADMTYELPAPDSVANESDVLISEKAQQTLANKTMNFDTSASGNVASNIPLTSLTSAAQATISGKAEQSTVSALDTRVTTVEGYATIYSAAWATADGSTKSISHSLGTKYLDVRVLEEDTGKEIWIDSISITTTTITLTANAPATWAWRVYWRKLS